MHNLMRERYWSMFNSTKHKYFYYAFYKQSCDIRIMVTKIFLAVISCAGITAWTIWDKFPGLWAVILAISQIVSVSQEYMPFYKQSAGIEYLLSDLSVITTQIASDWNRVDDMTPEQIIEKIESYQMQITELENKFLSSFAFLYSKSAHRKAENQTKKFFEYYTLENNSQEGVS